MVRISEDLVRKRAEHNNCELSTLEEVSLHQLDIERLEFLDKFCRKLKILYLQSNLIPKIENVGRLKELEYLNLALNNVEKVENLEGCESLQKLDLTVNFIGELTSIKRLQVNNNLKELFLTGNPCTQFIGYREYVIVTLPQLKSLDGREVEKSERILAKQDYETIFKRIIDEQNKYKKETECKRNEEKKTRKDEESNSNFWQEQVEYTPESRIEIHKHLEEQRKETERNEKREEITKKDIKFFTNDGRPLNMNHGKLDFVFTDDEENNVFLFDLSCPKYMDTSLIHVDLQTTYLRVNVKGKILQLALPEEIKPDSCSAKRSQVTGHLLITMAKSKDVVKPNNRKNKTEKRNKEDNIPSSWKQSKKLEINPALHREMDFSNIVTHHSTKNIPHNRVVETLTPNEDFLDDPEVPPLI